ncbi:NADPH:quinone reductase [Rhodococcus aerolatus]
MRAVGYARAGDLDVLELLDLPEPHPGPGEVRVRVALSGVNPTDWKSRSTSPHTAIPEGAHQVPHHDGAGTVDEVGEGVDPGRVGQRVWVWLAAYQRLTGTAQELALVPAELAVPLPDAASFELGADLGVPFLTAARCLTVAEGGPSRLAAGALAGRTVLVAGGAGAVGNAAIQLAVWAGAQVVTTVSGPAKGELARAAGAHHVVDYTATDVAAAVRGLAPDGVHTVVEVAPAQNAAIDAAVLAPDGVVAIYANNGGDSQGWGVRPLMTVNARLQHVLLYTVPAAAKAEAVAGVVDAVAAGALRVGEEAGLPLHRYPLAETVAAQRAVQDGAVGKVLVDPTR